jgi:tripartite-type tricarboxylate transporter receptor subunit TctC
MRVTSRRTLLLAAAAGPALRPRPALAQDPWPARPVTVVSPFAPGGAADVLTRPFAQYLSAEFGQPFVVESRPGAGGTIAHAHAARSRPDGYTLLFSSNSTYAIARHLYQLTYDPDAAFAPIALLARTPQVMCVAGALPATTLAEFMALVRAAPGRYGFGSAGIGFSSHLAAELFLAMAGLSMLHVPYRGGGAASQALLTNEVQLNFADAPSALSVLQGGGARALAVSTRRRAPVLPTVPTLDEAGLPGYESSTDYAFVAPAGVPEPILSRLTECSLAYVRLPERRGAIEAAGFLPDGRPPEEFRRLAAEDSAKWGATIRERGIRVQ